MGLSTPHILTYHASKDTIRLINQNSLTAVNLSLMVAIWQDKISFFTKASFTGYRKLLNYLTVEEHVYATYKYTSESTTF